MHGRRTPSQTIEDYYSEQASWSEDAILAALAALPPLPDEGSLEWAEDATWDQAYRYLALAASAASRRLIEAVPLLLERAAFGDPGEMMRGLRHSLEAIVNPDWDALASICIELASSARPGTRLWALDQLGILEDERARHVFEAASSSTSSDIREAGERGLWRLDKRRAL